MSHLCNMTLKRPQVTKKFEKFFTDRTSPSLVGKIIETSPSLVIQDHRYGSDIPSVLGLD